MNILILVGIFFVALIAIVAAVLLVMSERETESRAGNSAMMNPRAMLAAGTGTSPSRGAAEGSGRSAAAVSLPAWESEAATGRGTPAASVSTSMTRTLPPMDRESFPIAEVQDGSNLDGQFHELSAELRALHTRAQQMEQRIGMVMEIVDHLEHDHGDLIDISNDSEG